ncbi:hypothetical protein QCA50_009681 [Cerrena zonata]|uniref:Uncharacterized protein n=1 Tax=Cerrena zonata TaxID=2478898 RepID=A0AAW0GB96_9APHY
MSESNSSIPSSPSISTPPTSIPSSPVLGEAVLQAEVSQQAKEEAAAFKLKPIKPSQVIILQKLSICIPRRSS